MSWNSIAFSPKKGHKGLVRILKIWIDLWGALIIHLYLALYARAFSSVFALFRQMDFQCVLLDRFREGIGNNDLVGSCGRGIWIASVFLYSYAWQYMGVSHGGSFPPLFMSGSAFSIKLYCGCYGDQLPIILACRVFGFVCLARIRKRVEKGPAKSLGLKPSGCVISIGIFLLSYVVLYLVLSRFTDSDVPYLGIHLPLLSAFVGMWLMAKRKWKWIAWIIYWFGFGFQLYSTKGLILTFLSIFLFFTVLATLGLIAVCESNSAKAYANKKYLS